MVKRFWNDACDEITRQLWSPQTTQLHPENSNSWFQTSGSRFEENSKKTKTLNYHSSKVEPQKDFLRCRKVRVVVSEKDKRTFRKWFGDARYTYNKCLSLIKNKEKKINFYHLRNKYVLNNSLEEKEAFLKNTPKDIRAGAVKQLVDAYLTNFKVRQKKPDHTFDIRFRSKKKSLQEQIKVPASAFKFCSGTKGQKMYVRYTEDAMVGKYEKLPETINHECNFIRDGLGRYYLCVPITIIREAERVNVTENQVGVFSDRVVALDPGVRVFMTSFSNADGEQVRMYGQRATSTLIKLAKYKDRMISFEATCPKKRKRYNLRKVQKRIQMKMKNLVRDMHDKIITDLLKRYDVIIIPTFGVSQMTKRGKRKLRKCQVRGMLALSHYGFRQRLKEKAETMPNKRVFECTEEYTNLKHDLKGAEIYECHQCGLIILRDVNGARNILIKFIESRPSEFIFR